MTQRDAMDAFLEAATERVLDWGAWDCLLTPSDWVVISGHGDPAAEWRGRYGTALGAARIVSGAGGLEALATASAAHVGLQPTSSPRLGDIGLMRTARAPDLPVEVLRSLGLWVPASLRDLSGAVCIGGGAWATASSRGLAMFQRPEIAAAWRVEWRTR